jgi:hypothetical protein
LPRSPIHSLLRRLQISDATIIDRIRGLFLYMWRAINRSVPRAFSERRNVSTYAGDLLSGAMLFNKRFTAAWAADGYRDYLSPEQTPLESGKAVLTRLLRKGAAEGPAGGSGGDAMSVSQGGLGSSGGGGALSFGASQAQLQQAGAQARASQEAADVAAEEEEAAFAQQQQQQMMMQQQQAASRMAPTNNLSAAYYQQPQMNAQPGMSAANASAAASAAAASYDYYAQMAAQHSQRMGANGAGQMPAGANGGAALNTYGFSEY